MIANERTGRSRADDILITELAAGSTVAAAAIAADVSPATVYRRLEDAAFAARLRDMRGLAVRTAAGRLAAAMTKAVDVMAALLDSATEATRLRAADRLLDHAVKTAEVLELDQRLAELERVMATQTKGARR